MRIVVAYSGRFQPFGPHHFASYRGLCNKFGEKNVFILTSNKVSVDSPLNFNEKKLIMERYRIPLQQVIQVANPYRTTELAQMFDMSNTSLVVAVGEKDKNRLQRFKADDSAGYFKPYLNNQLSPANKNGYVYTLPNVRLNVPGYGIMCGTTLRKFIPNATSHQFAQVFGWFDPTLFEMLKKKLSQINEDITIPINIGDVVLGGKFKNKKVLVKSIERNEKGDITINGKPLLRFRIIPTIQESLLIENGASPHIKHPYENLDLTFSDVKELINNLLSGNIPKQDVTEKIDGQALAITYKDGNFLCARNKSNISNPMTFTELSQKMDGNAINRTSFTAALQYISNVLGKVSDSLLNKFFKNGEIFLHIEIVNPVNKNVIDYGQPSIVFLSMSKYSEDGVEIATVPTYLDKLYNMILGIEDNDNPQFKLQLNSHIQLKKLSNYSEEIENLNTELDSLMEVFSLEESDNIAKYYMKYIEFIVNKTFPKLSSDAKSGLVKRWAVKDKSIKLSNQMFVQYYDQLKAFETDKLDSALQRIGYKIEILFLKLGSIVLKNIPSTLSNNSVQIINDIRKNIKTTIEEIQKSGNESHLKFMQDQLKKIKDCGGMANISSVEGIVFKYKNSIYKLTGLFAPINQLLGILKYN